MDDPQVRDAGGVGAGQDRVESPGWWVFTFGMGHEHRGHYVRIHGTFSEARAEMVRRFGSEWAFQYSEDAWQETVRSMTVMGWPVETELEERDD